jgi:hypothetical protein
MHNQRPNAALLLQQLLLHSLRRNCLQLQRLQPAAAADISELLPACLHVELALSTPCIACWSVLLLLLLLLLWGRADACKASYFNCAGAC